MRGILNPKDHVCPWWFAYTFDNPFRRFIHNTKRILSPYLQKGMTAVDIGCGLGYFTIGMAEIVGENGRVISVDIQKETLKITQKRAEKRGLTDRIQLSLAKSDNLGFSGLSHFILSFWMVHEVPDTANFMIQVVSHLEPQGKYLIAEPRFHVNRSTFQEIESSAFSAGMEKIGSPKIAMSRTALFRKGQMNGR